MKESIKPHSPVTLLESAYPVTLAEIKKSLQHVFMPQYHDHSHKPVKIGLSVDYHADEGVQADAKDAWGYTIPKAFDAITAIGTDKGVEVIPLWHELMFKYMQTTSSEHLTIQLAHILRTYAINAIVIPGNEFDVHPKYYNEQIESTTKLATTRRTGFELLLVKVCTEILGIPVLGICGGTHVIVVSAGGTLTQEIKGHNFGGCGVDYMKQSTMLNISKPSLIGGAILKTISPMLNAHHLRTNHTALNKACETSELDVTVVKQGDFFVVTPTNCAHHQAIKMIPNSLDIIGLDATDNNIEAIENAHRSAPIIGVQYHPEVVTCDALDEDATGFGTTYTPLHLLYFQLIINAAKTHADQQTIIRTFKQTLTQHQTDVTLGHLKPSLFSSIKNDRCANDVPKQTPGLA